MVHDYLFDDPTSLEYICKGFQVFLAHLEHSANMSFWDRAVSVARRRASSVVRRPSCVNNLLKHLLLRFDWAYNFNFWYVASSSSLLPSLLKL